MPMRSRRPCAQQGCPNLVSRGKCVDHGGVDAAKVASEQARGSARKRGYDADWERLRLQVLAEEPICMCDEHQGRFDAPASTDVDHIVPHQGPSDPLFWDRKNLRAKAHACHSRKTASRDGGFGNPVRRSA